MTYRLACIKMMIVYLGAWALGRYTNGEAWTVIPGLALGFLSISALRDAQRSGRE